MTRKHLRRPDSNQMGLGLTPSVADSPAKTYRQPESLKASTPIDPAYGQTLPGLLARFDRESCSWKTSQTCLLALATNEGPGLAEFSETWPRSGMMRNGIAYKLEPLARRMDGTGLGWLPTPSANEDAAGSLDGNMQHMLTHAVKMADLERTKAGGQLSRDWTAWLMGFPVDWLESVR